MEEIETFSIVQPVGRAFESANEKALKYSHLASFLRSRKQLKRAEAGLPIEARSESFAQNENLLS